jgi:hypothetical protein
METVADSRLHWGSSTEQNPATTASMRLFVADSTTLPMKGAGELCSPYPRQLPSKPMLVFTATDRAPYVHDNSRSGIPSFDILGSASADFLDRKSPTHGKWWGRASGVGDAAVPESSKQCACWGRIALVGASSVTLPSDSPDVPRCGAHICKSIFPQRHDEWRSGLS